MKYSSPQQVRTLRSGQGYCIPAICKVMDNWRFCVEQTRMALPGESALAFQGNTTRAEGNASLASPLVSRLLDRWTLKGPSGGLMEDQVPRAATPIPLRNIMTAAAAGRAAAA